MSLKDQILARTRKDASLYDRELDFDGNWAKTLDRDGWKCCFCQCDLTKTKPTVHHKDGMGYTIKKKKANNKMDNLISMCNVCHVRFHRLANRLNSPRSKECLNCGKYFHQVIKRTIFCSIKCSSIYRYKEVNNEPK